MAIKSDRDIFVDRIDCYINEAAGKGKIALFSTSASGVGLDNPTQLVTISASPSGKKIAGVVMNEVVSIDSSRAMLNTQKDQVAAGGKVTLAKKGWIVVDNIEGAVTAQEDVYVGQSGNFATKTAVDTFGAADGSGSSHIKIGKFDTAKDENGFARINLEIV